MLTSVPKSRKCWDLEFRDSPILTLFLFQNNVFARFILTIVADDTLPPCMRADTTQHASGTHAENNKHCWWLF